MAPPDPARGLQQDHPDQLRELPLALPHMGAGRLAASG